MSCRSRQDGFRFGFFILIHKTAKWTGALAGTRSAPKSAQIFGKALKFLFFL